MYLRHTTISTRVIRRFLLIFCLSGVAAFASASCVEPEAPSRTSPDAGESAREDAGEFESTDGSESVETGGIQIQQPADGTLFTDPTVDVTASVDSREKLSKISLRVDGRTVRRTDLENDVEVPFEHTFSDLDLSAHDRSERPVALRVVGYGSDDRIVAGSTTVEVLVDSRKKALEKMRDASEVEPVVRWNRNGLPEVARFDLPVEGDNPVEKGLGFVEIWDGIFQLDDPRNVLAPGDIQTREDGRTEVQFQQHAGDFPVAGGHLTLTLEEGRATLFTGTYIEDLPEPGRSEETDHRVEKERAEEIALDAVEGKGRAAVGYTRRVVYDPAIFETDVESDPTIAWRVAVQGIYAPERDSEGTLRGLPGSWDVYVDARTGEVLASYQTFRDGNFKDLRVKVLNARGKRASAGFSNCMSKTFTKVKPACFKNINFRKDGCNGNADGDGDCGGALSHGKKMHRWLERHFGWTSNKKGGIIKPFTNVTFKRPNAYSLGGWCNNQILFADDWETPNIFFHEFGHRLVNETGTSFTYSGQSGALDEHYADLFAALVVGEKNGTGFDPLIGDNRPSGNTFRNMKNPGVNRGCRGNPHPASMSNFRNVSCDHGGVHSNSTIPSKATYLLAKGGIHNGWEFRFPIGPDKLRKIAWKTLKSSNTDSSSNFIQYASTMVKEANQAYSYKDAGCQVRNAFASVGILVGDSDCDGRLNGAESDNDDDGVSDSSDNCPKEFNASQKDTDGDGTGDACTDDIDGDGVVDEHDNCRSRKNPSQTDTDSNGVGDMCEDVDGDYEDGYEDNCPNVPNMFQEDLDGDGVGDKCDKDTDGDGVEDSSDNCDRVQNPSQRDADGDGIGNKCDDEDDDGVLDVNDNCPNVHNPNQSDNDDDGKPDACADQDDDNDGIVDENDNCRTIKNEAQTDTDGDGHGDECDNCHNPPGVAMIDTDQDGIPDHCDIDDDKDGILDEADNCPNTANLRQRDFDDDGVGAACSSDIPSWAWGGSDAAKEIFAQPCELGQDGLDCSLGYSSSIDICKSAECKERGYVPEGTKKKIELSSSTPFSAAVVDGCGEMVRAVGIAEVEWNDSSGKYEATITFEPEQDSYYKTESADRGVFQGRTYKLRVNKDAEYSEGDGGDPSVKVEVEESQGGGL